MQTRCRRVWLIVYSIGPDMIDDGGTPFDRDKKTGDVTFKLVEEPNSGVRETP